MSGGWDGDVLFEYNIGEGERPSPPTPTAESRQGGYRWGCHGSKPEADGYGLGSVGARMAESG